jgi:hypothetical protein
MVTVRTKVVSILMFASCIFCNVDAAESVVGFEKGEHELKLQIDGRNIASYVFEDEQLSRPYFAHVKTLTGKQVTRNHPPQEGLDKLDHADWHPGVWLSFGDINGNDYWRLKAKTQHVRFVEPPSVQSNVGTFAVQNHYLSNDDQRVVCVETCSYTVRLVPSGYMLSIASEFHSTNGDVRFGDQEEMGLGIRLATTLAVETKSGGRILDSEGRRNGKEIWGKQARWCDYSGPFDGAWIGMTILTSPTNFRPSWTHARDYGLVAMNPFGVNAFTKQPRQDVTVKQGESFKLSFAVVVHETDHEEQFDPDLAYRSFVKTP